MILFILFKNECRICPTKMRRSEIVAHIYHIFDSTEKSTNPAKLVNNMATFPLRPAAPSQLNCKCWPTSRAALPPDLFRASVCSLCIYRLFSSCPQTALQICRNSKRVPRFQRGSWWIAFSSVNPLTLADRLHLERILSGILLKKE